MKNVVVAYIVFVLIFLVIAAVLIGTGHASTTKARPNSLGVDQVYENNNGYLLALPVEATRVGDDVNIRYQPYNTPALYDESLLFCGDVSAYFHNSDGSPKRGVLVIVYDKVGHHMYSGMACHEIVNVFTMEVQR